MLKSAYDHRQFNYIILSNGLRVLLVQDINCTKSAASVTLKTGHFNDDDDCHGLGHLLEHMLFLGNKSFPATNAFHDFLSHNDGCMNASTGTEYTHYFYDVSADHEQQALNHLASMLYEPLFSESLIEKEINAIDAEFWLKQKDDLRRLYQVHKETCNPSHPFSKFSVGNAQTFSHFTPKQLKEKLKRIHKHFYHPQNACLCVISKHDVSLIEQYVVKCFTGWPSIGSNSSTQPCPLRSELYLPHNLGVQINILPLQSAKRMILTFALPEQHSHFRSKPLSVISHIIGDEGEGGLLDFYKTKNWATSLSAGGGIEGSTFKDFNINLQLTDEGIKHSDDIITAFFSYINLMRKNGVETWRIKETATLNKLMWDFSDQAKAVDEASHFSQSMFEYPQEYIIAGDYLLDQTDSNTSIEMLGYFEPENMRIKNINQQVETDCIAKWYNTPYSVKAIAPERIISFLNGNWQDSFRLPKANPFLRPPSPVNKINSNFTVPKKIISQIGLNLWFGQDDKFLQPKGDCYLTFDCQAVHEGIDIITSKRLWIALLNEKLNQKYYQANLAGMHFHLYPHQAGFSLQTNGFSSGQLGFCTNLLRQIVINDYFERDFSQIKAKQLQGLSNVLLNKPINRLFSRLSVLMQQQNHAPLDMAQVMQNLTPDDIHLTKSKLLDQFHLEGFMYGDWILKDTHKVSENIKKFRQQYHTCQKIHRGVADIRQHSVLLHQVECQHKDSAVVIYFQAPDASIQNEALTILVEQLIAAPFFNQLRTEQQLGYLVGSGYIPYNQHPGLGFYIQSPHTQPAQLIDAIHLFLQQLVENIDQFSDLWGSIKKGVIKQLTEKDSNLKMKSQRLWMAIGSHDESFNYNKKLIQTIIELDFLSLKTYLTCLISRQGFGEAVLFSGQLDNSATLSEVKIVTDIQKFKSNSPYI